MRIHSKFQFFFVLAFCSIFLFVLSSFAVHCAGEFVKNDYQGSLNSTERVCRSTGESVSCHYEWRFRGTNGFPDEVFANRDSIVNTKFNSADFENRVEVGQEYRLVVTGWRIPVLSMFRNVISVEVVL